MKASEIPVKDKTETKNFQRRNLRGKSFKGRKDLSGADFSEADLRGTDFTNANLQGAKFVGAKCGLPEIWGVRLTLLSSLLISISELFSLFAGFFVSSIFSSNPSNQITAWTTLLVLIIFLIFTIREGVAAAFVRAVVVVLAIVAAVIVQLVAGFEYSEKKILNIRNELRT